MSLDFLHFRNALRVFASADSHQSQEHIKPTHRYTAIRLVVEGGFLPEEVFPHPPLLANSIGAHLSLEYAPSAETSGELTVFGGMKTKQIDVVVLKSGIGPVVAISVKGTFRAYRNLVNRMEEAIGDSTNLHVMYPGLVYGFLSLLRANREEHGYSRNDVGITRDGTISPQIRRYWSALSEMTGRRFVRNDFTRYESVASALVENNPDLLGAISEEFPPADSLLRVEHFFKRLFEVYDLRFPFRADHLIAPRRVAWRRDSPFFEYISNQFHAPLDSIFGYAPRLSD